MLKITLETELKTVSISVPTFVPDTDIFEYMWEIRNVLIAYGFQQRYVDQALSFIDEDESIVDEILDEMDEKKLKKENLS